MHLLVTSLFCYFFLINRLSFLTAAAAADDIAINCGSSGNSVGPDGRRWVGDVGSQFLFPRRRTKSNKAFSFTRQHGDSVFSNSARISTAQFSYTFRVNAGQKFIRLHFCPPPYPLPPGWFQFHRSMSNSIIFTVKAGPYTLLRNFTPSVVNAVDASLGKISSHFFMTKEFCLNFDQEQALTITFSPSSPEAYALINGVEILSVPTGLYHTPDGDQGGSLIVGQKHRRWFHIDNSTALELIQRVNIGGGAILPRDDIGSTSRAWSADIDYWLEPGISPIITANNITYVNITSSSSNVVAPQRLYQTARFVNHMRLNLTRQVMVDVGFRYLIRLHFCELDEAIRGRGQRQFNIYVNERIAESKADLFEWSGGSSNLALHRDYVVTMLQGDGEMKEQGKRKLVVALEPICYHEESNSTEQVVDVVLAGAILNGLEVFKLSNPDNNLAGQNSYPLSSSKSPLLPLLVFYNTTSSTVSGLIVLLTLLNIVFYKLRSLQVQADKSADKKKHTSYSCRTFSLEEMVVAANNFDEALVIGDGGFGRVYKGVIDKGAITVAVKRLKSISKQGADEFWTEIKTLSKIRQHPHLVTLIGYCDESDEKILVYEYAVNGTLADHLYMKKKNKKNTNTITSRTDDRLSWEQRLNICIGAARGLEYLHTGAQHKIIHRDVKASNILLGDNWVAKISDFGLSKMSGNNETLVMTTDDDIMGTFGYLDTDYFLTQRLTRKSDVYAFGVLLFEVLCGRPAIDRDFEGEQRSLALWAQRCIKDGKLHLIIDPDLKGQISPHSLKAFAELAVKCLHNRPNRRPRMPDVLQRLEFALLLSQTQQHAYSEEEDDADADADADAGESSIIDNIQIDPITEEEADDDENNCGTDGHGSAGSTPVSLQDSISTISRAKSQKKTYSKVFDGIAKNMDLRRRRKPKMMNGSNNIQEANAISCSSSSSSGGRTAWWRQRTRSFGFGEARLSTSSSLPEQPSCRHFSLAEIRAATKNFHRNLIIKYGGPGGGEMYRGYIGNGGYLQVAIERLTTRATNYYKSKFVEEEVELRSQLYHPNLVPFIGYCKDEDEDEMVLVYQYMAKGNLSNHLYGTPNEPPLPLPWKKRLQICIGAAQGLQYLHNTNLENPIIHGNIKTSSILLDEKWVAKISGGLKFSKGGGDIDAANNKSSLSTTTRTIVRTIVIDSSSSIGGGGYMDPDYYNVLSGGGGHNHHLTKESDVYSLGVVLLEVLCAREPLIPHLVNRDEKNLVHWFKSCMQKKEIDRIIDQRLIGKIAPKCLRVFVRIVEWCLHFRAIDRPSIDVVLRKLQDALLLQEGAGDGKF